MHPDKGAFADQWVSKAERANMPPHLGVIVTYVDIRGKWTATTVATESATQPGEWGYYCARRMTGGEHIGALLDTCEPTGPSRYLIETSEGTRDAAKSRPGGPRCANDPRGTKLAPNAICYETAMIHVAPFAEINPLRPDLTAPMRKKCEIMWSYGEDYWIQHLKSVSNLPPILPQGPADPKNQQTL